MGRNCHGSFAGFTLPNVAFSVAPARAGAAADGDILERVRQRAVRFASLAFTAAGVAGLFVLLCTAILALSALVNIATNLRGAIGVAAPEHGRDWYLLALVALAVGIPLLVLLAAYRSYRRIWLRRVRAVWGPCVRGRQLRRWSTFRSPPNASDARGREARLVELRALLSTAPWESRWDSVRELGLLARPGSAPMTTDYHPRTISEDEYPAVAAGMLRTVERDIALRATAVGLTVGVSQNRWVDTTTIVAASLEIQLAVLSRLGKRPSLAMWRRLGRNCGASVLVNTYLNRGDVLVLNLAVQKAAMGFQVLADLTAEGLDLLGQLDLDEAIDAVFDVVDIPAGGIAGTITRTALYGMLATTEFGLGVGEIGLRHLSTLTQRLADDLVQGVIAGGILYHHGMVLAADVLALDTNHRNDPALRRGMLDGMTQMRVAAQDLAVTQVRAVRDAYRQRRRQSISRIAVSPSIPDALRRRVQRAAGDVEASGPERPEGQL